jgi:hypothetical protein
LINRGAADPITAYADGEIVLVDGDSKNFPLCSPSVDQLPSYPITVKGKLYVALS